MAERVFAMPDLGEGLEEGRIVRWLVAEGATVELNQPLVEVETAKAVVEIPSPFAGKIQALHGSNGEDVPVGRALVTFEVTGGAVAYLDMVSVDQPSSGPVPATPPVRMLAKELGVDIQTVRGTGTHARVTEEHARELAETQATLQTIAELARQVSSTADPRGLVCETAVRTSGASVATLIEPDGRGGFQILDETGVESIVFEPIVRNDKPVGVLGLGWTEARSELDDRTANVVTYLAAEAGAEGGSAGPAR